MLPEAGRLPRSDRLGGGVDAPAGADGPGEEANKVCAFSIGGDDYVTKPFGILELMALVRAPAAHQGRGDAPIPAVERFEIEVNPASRTVYRAGQLVSLAPREFDLLLALLKRQGAAVSRPTPKEVWQYQTGVAPAPSISISPSSAELEPDQAEPSHIRTVWKVGYRLER